MTSKSSNSYAGISYCVPIYNSLSHVRICLNSLVNHLTVHDELILGLDGCEPYIEAEIRKIVEPLAGRCNVISRVKNEGYLFTINEIFRLAKKDIVCSLNSDTAIFKDTSERALVAFEDNQNLSILNPVSTWANLTRIDFPQGADYLSIHDYLVDKYPKPKLVEIPHASGFAYFVRKSHIDQDFLFDPIFGKGYWEETDLCMRMVAKGFSVMCDLGMYVYHHGWASFGEGNRNDLMDANKVIFLKRWEYQYNNRISAMEGSRQPLEILELSQHLQSLGPKFWGNYNSAGKLRIKYVLPSLGFYGGVISVIQLMNGLLEKGCKVSLYVYGKADKKIFKAFPFLFSPVFVDDVHDYIVKSPLVGVSIATSWDSVQYVHSDWKEKPSQKLVYFVQDYEPRFSNDPLVMRLIDYTYSLIDLKICKSEWLKRMLVEKGSSYDSVAVIPLGLDMDNFFPNDSHNSFIDREYDLVVACRPTAYHRNWTGTKEIIESIHKALPNIKVAIYGHGYTKEDIPDFVIDLGHLAGPPEVAKILNNTKTLIDASFFQGFGRPALEAMACGCIPFTVYRGGLTSYAVHGHNCFLIRPENVNETVNAYVEIFKSIDMWQSRLKNNMYVTASSYNCEYELEKTISFFRKLQKS